MSPPVNCSPTHPLSAAYYADCAAEYRAAIVENVQLARDTFRVRMECPRLAEQIIPGQFVMLRLVGCNDPLLGRPLALYDTVLDQEGRPLGIDVVYLLVGKMTSRLAQCRPGDLLDIWGPLGNGFSREPVDHLLMAAGGIGQTPFLALGRQFLGGRSYGNPPQPIPRSKKVTLCYGVRTKELLAGTEDFRKCGIELAISSDDGSVGRHGLVTDLVRAKLNERNAGTLRIACCGPEKMMEAVAALSAEYAVSCEVSLETPMACGIGICFSCVVRVVQPDGDWDYKRTCVDGPVFESSKIVW